MAVELWVIPRDRVRRVMPLLRDGLEVYREKSPHEIGSDEELLENLESPEGDELAIVLLDRRFVGFMTFKVMRVDGEVWGTLAIIYVSPVGQKAGVLPEAGQLMEGELRSRGCTVMNYMTARRGFRRLAPALGFKPRIIEWMKEL